MAKSVLDPRRLADATDAQHVRLRAAGISDGCVAEASAGPTPDAADVTSQVRSLLEAVLLAHDHGLADPAARRLAVRAAATLLAQQAPGRSVELRVPPDTAVQCVPGPRHTRGTPPAVVETDPFTFLRLAVGRTQWDDEVRAGRVRRSGQRTDLRPWLPVVPPRA